MRRFWTRRVRATTLHYSPLPLSVITGVARTKAGDAMPSASPCALVIFGASGDLAKRKLIPAIYEMVREKLLPEQFVLVGYARSPLTDQQYRDECRDAVQKFARTKPVDPAVWKKIEANIGY